MCFFFDISQTESYIQKYAAVHQSIVTILNCDCAAKRHQSCFVCTDFKFSVLEYRIYTKYAMLTIYSHVLM